MDPELNLTETRACDLKDIYPIEVDQSLEFEEMVQAGYYNDVHQDIVPPVSWITSFNKKENVNVVLLGLDQSMTTEEMLAVFKEKGVRPANIVELLAFGAQYPEVQWECPIVAFGSTWKNRDGDRGVAYLWYNPFGRALLLALIRPEKKWQPFCRFAVVSKLNSS